MGVLISLSLLTGFWGVVYVTRYRRARGRLEQYIGLGPDPGRARERRSALAGLGDTFDRTAVGQRLASRLHEADIPLKPSEWGMALLGACLALEFILHRFFGLVFPLDLALSLMALQWAPGHFLKLRRSRRGRLIGKQLSEVARLLGSALRAGLTVPQAIELASRRLAPPAGPEFRRVAGELHLGVPLSQALESLRRRSPGAEIDLLCTAILIHQEVGGDLAGAFDEMARTLAAREQANMEISSLTAESRFVAIMLPFMPLAAGLILNMIMPGFLMPLFTPAGMIVLALFIAVQVVGMAIIRAISRIEV